jgi:hypothetical protein
MLVTGRAEVWKTIDPLGSLGLEKCESGRIGLTANELTWETGSEGSNPSFSASLLSFRRVRNPSWTPPSLRYDDIHT